MMKAELKLKLLQYWPLITLTYLVLLNIHQNLHGQPRDDLQYEHGDCRNQKTKKAKQSLKLGIIYKASGLFGLSFDPIPLSLGQLGSFLCFFRLFFGEL